MKRGQWTEPVVIASGMQSSESRHPTWNPVLFHNAAGQLLLFYKVGPDPDRWWGMVKTSSDHGNTWTEGQCLPGGILGPTKNKPVRLRDGRIVCASSTEGERWRVHVEMSGDQGETWTRGDPVTDTGGFGAIQPAVLKHEGGRLQMLARSRSGCIVSSWSHDGGYTWSELEPTQLPNPNAGIDALTLMSGLHVVVYNHASSEPGEWGGPRTPLSVAVSTDGLDWRRVLTLEEEPGGPSYPDYESLIHMEDDPPEFSYPAVIQSEEGALHITYTWKRKSIRHAVVELEPMS